MISFYEHIKTEVDHGDATLSAILETLTLRKVPELSNMIEIENRDLFREPILYSYFNSAVAMDIKTIIVGFMTSAFSLDEIPVKTTSDGYIYIPNIGYFKFEKPIENLTLSYRIKEKQFIFKADNQIISFNFQPIYRLKNSNIEICLHRNIYFDNFFKQEELNRLDPEGTVLAKLDHIQKAMDILRNNFPYCYSLIEQSVSKLFIYKSETQRSFATMQANGTGFLNLKPEHDEIAILEDITHQCGHNIFYRILYDKKRLFNIPPDTPLREITGKIEEYRTVFGAFNAMLPYCLSNLCSWNCLKNGIFKGQQLHEFIGRFTFRMFKFKIDVGNFSHNEIFTEEGKTLNRTFVEVFDKIENDYGSVLKKYDISNQDYEFDYQKFLILNPYKI